MEVSTAFPNFIWMDYFMNLNGRRYRLAQVTYDPEWSMSMQQFFDIGPATEV